MGFNIQKGDGRLYDWRKLADDGELEALLSPLVESISAVLTGAEQLGRFAVHLIWLGLGELFRIEPEEAGEGSPPVYLPGGGLLTVDGLADSSEREALARRLERRAAEGNWSPGLACRLNVALAHRLAHETGKAL